MVTLAMVVVVMVVTVVVVVVVVVKFSSVNLKNVSGIQTLLESVNVRYLIRSVNKVKVKYRHI